MCLSKPSSAEGPSLASAAAARPRIPGDLKASDKEGLSASALLSATWLPVVMPESWRRKELRSVVHFQCHLRSVPGENFAWASRCSLQAIAATFLQDISGLDHACWLPRSEAYGCQPQDVAPPCPTPWTDVGMLRPGEPGTE